jgi:O-antigen/teichoic acid export membrane protein
VAGLTPTLRGPLVRGALLANGAIGILCGVAVALLFLAGPLRHGFETLSVALLVALTLPCIGLVAVARGVAQADRRYARLGGLQIAECGTRAVVGVGLTVLGGTVIGAIAGFVVGAGLAAGLGMAFLTRTAGARLRGAITPPSPRGVGSIVGAPLGLALLSNLDLIAVKLLSGGERTLAGLYQAATLLANIPYYLVASAIVPVLFTDLARRGDLGATRARVAEALRLVLVLVVPLELFLAVAPDAVLALAFPADYAPAAPLLRLLAIGNAALMLFAVLSTSFEATGRASISALVLTIVIVVESGVLWVVVPVWRAQGGALVFAAASTTALVALALVYVHAVGWAAFVRAAGWLPALAGPLVMTGAVGVGAYVATGNVVAAAVAGALTYALLAWLMRRRLFVLGLPATGP